MMPAQTLSTQTHVTEDDLLGLGSDVWAEVIEGTLQVTWPGADTEGVTRAMGPVGFLHGIVAGNVYDALKPYVTSHKLGYVLGDGVIYVLATEGEGIRTALVPDVSFVRKDRVPPGFNLSRPFPGAPDLAIEIVSPSDAAADVLAKVDSYLNAGTVEVWVLYPNRHEVYRYRQEADKKVIQLYNDSDQFTARELFPGLTLVVTQFFALPDLGE